MKSIKLEHRVVDTFSFKSETEIQTSDWSCSFSRAYWPSIRLSMTFDLHYLVPGAKFNDDVYDVTASNRVNLVDPWHCPSFQKLPLRACVVGSGNETTLRWP